MAASKSRGQKKPVRKTATCKTCGKKYRIPEGWSVGPATRRHYWAKHRQVMQPSYGDSQK